MTKRGALIRTMGVLVATSSLVAAPAQSKEEFSLAIELKAPYDQRLSVCTLVRTDEPFYVVLTNGKTNTFSQASSTRLSNRFFRSSWTYRKVTTTVG